MKVYFDGGWRPAAGMEAAVVIAGRSYIERGLGPGSAMEAEWVALLRAIDLADELELADPLFLGDALTVIRQATGAAKCGRAFVRYRNALSAAGSRRIRHIKRTQNLAGIALVRLHDR